MAAVTHAAQVIDTARARDSLLTFEAYCPGDCAVREVTVRVKDYDRQLVTAIRQRGLTCPVCGAGLRLHWVRTSREERTYQDRQARCAVNLQMRERDSTRADELSVVSARELLDDRLPPTPDGWFSARTVTTDMTDKHSRT